MIEKHIVLEDVDPVVFYGVGNVNFQIVKALYPKLRIVARGNVLHVIGDELEMCALEENVLKGVHRTMDATLSDGAIEKPDWGNLEFQNIYNGDVTLE